MPRPADGRAEPRDSYRLRLPLARVTGLAAGQSRLISVRHERHSCTPRDGSDQLWHHDRGAQQNAAPGAGRGEARNGARKPDRAPGQPPCRREVCGRRTALPDMLGRERARAECDRNPVTGERGNMRETIADAIDRGPGFAVQMATGRTNDGQGLTPKRVGAFQPLGETGELGRKMVPYPLPSRREPSDSCARQNAAKIDNAVFDQLKTYIAAIE